MRNFSKIDQPHVPHVFDFYMEPYLITPLLNTVIKQTNKKALNCSNGHTKLFFQEVNCFING
jgi:hypothetical protein